jgi:preprotein translocase subunit SecA
VEYKHEAFDMFGSMIADIQEEIVRIMYFAQLVERPQERRNMVAQHNSASAMGDAAGAAGRAAKPGQGAQGRAAGGARADAGSRGGAGGSAIEMAGPKQQPAVSNKIGRNDLCPCGSGKKYKKCCGRELA